MYGIISSLVYLFDVISVIDGTAGAIFNLTLRKVLDTGVS